MIARHFSFISAVIGVAAAVSGCERGSDPKPPITIELTGANIDIIPGTIGPGPTFETTKPLAFQVHRNGYDGPISLSVTAGSPISASVFTPPFDADGVLYGAVVLSVPAGTPSGTHAVTLKATAGTLGTVSASFTVSVHPFRMWINQQSLKISRGATNTLSVYFEKDPGRSIILSVSSGPAGVTIAQGSEGITGGRSFLDISAASDAPLGTKAMTVTASAGGLQESKTFEIVVQNAPPKRQIAFRVCKGQDVFGVGSYLYGYANDGEAWTSVVPDQDDVIRFNATEKVSFASNFNFKDPYSIGLYTLVIHTTATELEQMQCASAVRGTKTFPIKATNNQGYSLSLGAGKATSAFPAISGVRAGLLDLLAFGNRAVPTGIERAAVLRRALNLANGDTISLDFAGGEAVVLDSSTITAGTVDLAEATGRVHTTTTIAAADAGTANVPGGTTRWFWALPERLLVSGEIQSVSIASNVASGAPTRGAVSYFRAAAPRSVALGPDLATPVADAEANAITLPSQPEYPDVAAVSQKHVIDFRGIYHRVEVWQTKGFVGTTPQSWTFSADLGRFISVPPVMAGVPSALAGKGPAALFFGGTPADGAELIWAARGKPSEFLPFPKSR